MSTPEVHPRATLRQFTPASEGKDPERERGGRWMLRQFTPASEGKDPERERGGRWMPLEGAVAPLLSRGRRRAASPSTRAPTRRLARSLLLGPP
jgi:hypothetical protein